MEKPCSVQEVFCDVLVEKCCVPVGKGNHLGNSSEA